MNIGALRRREMGQQGSSLPYDAQVEWLQTDGIAYIDTGVKISSTLKFDIYLNVPTYASNVFFFGGRVSSTSGAVGVAIELARTCFSWRYGSKFVDGRSYSASDWRFYNTSTPRILSISGTTCTATAQTFSNNNTFFIFCMNNGGTPAGNAENLKFKSGKLYGNVNRDYIAVRKNGVGYLYDKISGELFGNAAPSGAFTYGNDVTT